MTLPQIVTVVDEGMGNTSYLVDLGDGRALAVDPSRDQRAMRHALAARALSVGFAADTHLHADFLSGARQLASTDAASVLASAAGGREFDHTGLRDGDEVDLGGLRLRALGTPGHTDEHLSFLLLDGAHPLSGRGRRCGSGTGGSPPTAPGTGSTHAWSPRPTRVARWTGACRWTPRSTALISTPRTRAESRPSQGAESSYTNLREEPLDHAIGRSRGGLSTKIHQLVDGHGRPLVVALTAGQAGDSPILKGLLAHLAVAREGPGRPRTRPDALLGDKAYSSRANRELLRSKRVKTVIAQPSDQVGHRQRRGSAGGRPPVFDAEAYKGRNVVERSFNDHKQWRALATRYDKLAAVYRGGVVLRAITIWLRE